MQARDTTTRHRPHEDVLALLSSTVLMALALTLYAHATLITGGAAGLALLVHYVTGYSFGAVFFVINLPFYVLAVRRLGWAFAIRTFIAVLLLSLLSRWTPSWIQLATVNPFYAAIAGGGLMGVSLLILFRHRAGLGGFNILALYLQDNHAIRAGYFQLALDLLILIAALFVLDWQRVALSVIGAVVLNLTLAINHKPGRYTGIS